MSKSNRVSEKPELLAPAGTIETFFAALEQGADAVYAGTPHFNARLRAKNFTFDELARMIAYAHGIGRKVYITLNTIVKESELGGLVETLDTLRRLGPDALIIQDLGVYRLARQLAPEIPLHASTQMTIHNADGARQLERMGFERVILAREMTLEEIKVVRRSSTIALETFVHGAMCYSISGQCNFSSYLHGKSANRGGCLQPCRRVYESGGQRTPLFAPLDLNTAPILFQLIAAGIRSFKIEGRLKPAETIAQTVAAYRRLIDAYPTSTKEVVNEAKQRLRLAIGRKASTGFYLSATPEDTMVGEGMSRSGRYLGKVAAVQGNTFELKSQEIIKHGDRINVQAGGKEAPRGFNIKDLFLGNKRIARSRPGQTVKIAAPFKVTVGAAVVKVIDADAEPEEATKHDEKKWPHATARAKVLFPAKLHYRDDGAIVVETEVNGQPLSVEEWPSFAGSIEPKNACELLSQEDDSASVQLSTGAGSGLSDDLPMTGEEVLALRKTVLDAIARGLDTARDTVLSSLEKPMTARNVEAKKEQLVRISSIDDIQWLPHWEDIAIILPITQAKHAAFAAHIQSLAERDAVLCALPTFDFDRQEALQSALKQALEAGVRRFMVSNLAHFRLLEPHMKRGLSLVAGDPFHGLNRPCVEALAELGADLTVFAQEGDRETLEALIAKTGPERIVVQVYGKVPLFRSRQPHPKGVQHASSIVGGREELDMIHRDGLIHVIPSRDFSLRHLMPVLHGMGITRFLYDLTGLRSLKKSAKKTLTGGRTFDPKAHTAMNFERGLS